MEMSVSDCKEVIWGVLDDHGVEEPKENHEIGLRVFNFNLFGADKEGGSLFIIFNEDM